MIRKEDEKKSQLPLWQMLARVNRRWWRSRGVNWWNTTVLLKND